jgi:hypothetical protein
MNPAAMTSIVDRFLIRLILRVTFLKSIISTTGIGSVRPPNLEVCSTFDLALQSLVRSFRTLALRFSCNRSRFYCFWREERRISNKTPTIIRIKGHHRVIKERSSQPRFDRRKIMPKAIRIYAAPDLDFITFPP